MQRTKNKERNMESNNSQQIVDTLTSHIGLYHSSIPPSLPLPTNPRSQILQWFASLSVAHRQSHLTILYPQLVQVLIIMHRRILLHGHGTFFLLPDLPSRSSIPSICFRRSRGLIARSAASASQSSHCLSRSLLLFSSSSSSSSSPDDTAHAPSINSLDALTVSDSLVSDIDRFVSVVDAVSDGRFLRGSCDSAASDGAWPELPWLKAKGYYTVEAFAANWLEIALRMSWMNSGHNGGGAGGGKKRGGIVKANKVGGAAAAPGVAANVFWRKKGCLDWWDGLDPGDRKRMITVILGKSAKSMVLCLSF